MKVYIVIGNWCDDTWIHKVFAQRNAAEEEAKTAPLVNKNNPHTTRYCVEEWEVQS